MNGLCVLRCMFGRFVCSGEMKIGDSFYLTLSLAAGSMLKDAKVEINAKLPILRRRLGGNLYSSEARANCRCSPHATLHLKLKWVGVARPLSASSME